MLQRRATVVESGSNVVVLSQQAYCGRNGAMRSAARRQLEPMGSDCALTSLSDRLTQSLQDCCNAVRVD